jgi:hypothetical protein
VLRGVSFLSAETSPRNQQASTARQFFSSAVCLVSSIKNKIIPMATCVICATETLLRVNDTPLCLTCDEASPAEREKRKQAATEKALVCPERLPTVAQPRNTDVWSSGHTFSIIACANIAQE